MYLLVDIETGGSWPIDLDWVEENIDELEAGALDHMGLRIELEDTSKLKKWNSHGIIA